MRWFKCLSKEEREVLQKQVAAERERKRQELQAKLDVYKVHAVCSPMVQLDGTVKISSPSFWTSPSGGAYIFTLEHFYREYQPKLEAALLAKVKQGAEEIERLRKDLYLIANGEENTAEAVLLKYKKQTLVYSNSSNGIPYPSTISGYWMTDSKLYVNGQEVVTKKPRKQKGKKK